MLLIVILRTNYLAGSLSLSHSLRPSLYHYIYMIMLPYSYHLVLLFAIRTTIDDIIHYESYILIRLVVDWLIASCLVLS